MTQSRNSLAVPVEMAIACCSPVAEATLAMWLRLGAKLKPTAMVILMDRRLVAVIDFQERIQGPERGALAIVAPLIVTMADGLVGDQALERIRACDDLVAQLRERQAAR